MKTKIVYCLVSDPNDYYYEQLLISLCSLRKHNPDVKVEVFCDTETYATLRDHRSGIYDYNIDVIPVQIPQEYDVINKVIKSRYIKTNLRKLTRGDFLFVDTDTIICSSLTFVDDFTFDVAAVKHAHIGRAIPEKDKAIYGSEIWILKEAEKIGANIHNLWHFNSGVMYVKDVKKSYELYSKWSEHYFNQLKLNVFIDQLSLLLSNHEMGEIITPLDYRLNCQVCFDSARNKVSGASIIHYIPRHKKTILSSPWLMDPIKDSGKINPSIQRIIDNPYDFFYVLSEVVKGEKADLLNTPGLCEAHSACPNVFKLWLNGLKLYLAIKKWLYRVVHF